jgi:gamma-glutamyl hercynylcysteine S-oxide synthase
VSTCSLLRMDLGGSRGAEWDLATVALAQTREQTLQLIAELDDVTLESVHSSLMSPLVWDLGHIAAFEDLWISRSLAEPILRPDLIDIYDADETPRAKRGELPFLKTDEAFAYLETVRSRTLRLLEDEGRQIDPDRLELILRHEQQHNETMFQTLQLAHLDCPFGDALERFPADVTVSDSTGLHLVEIDGAAVPIGADPADGFAYDNEKPRHIIEVEPFRIGRTPVTNAGWLDFIERGGYERPEWWSPEGWVWRTEEQASRPLAWTQDGRQWRLGELLVIDPSEPVIHVSWFEADAFARAYGLRLPTEFEWEMAATWDPVAEARVTPETARPSALGILGMIGNVWEWTSTTFNGYPGFVAHPYREYSEQFFRHHYRVLRGGSWVTRPPMATATFRNWDLPQRRQIFSGLRLAGDAR